MPYLVCICSQRYTKRASQTEISQLEVAVLVDEKILRFQIAVKHTMSMAVPHALTQLHHELLDHDIVHDGDLSGQPTTFWESFPTSSLADWQGLHVFLEIEVEKLHDEVELVPVGVDNVEEANNVGVIHLLEERDFADGC